MAKQVIVLERRPGTRIAFRVAYWLAVPLARQQYYANPAATSQFDGASAGELTALRNGEFVEVVEDYIESGANPSETLAQVQANVIARFGVLQTALTNDNTYSRYG